MIKKAQEKAMLSKHSTLAQVIIVDMDDDKEEYVCAGQYYGTGFIIVTYKGRELAFDPTDFHPKDPKRLYIVKSETWSRFRVRSIILDSKSILKTGKSTSIR